MFINIVAHKRNMFLVLFFNLLILTCSKSIDEKLNLPNQALFQKLSKSTYNSDPIVLDSDVIVSTKLILSEQQITLDLNSYNIYSDNTTEKETLFQLVNSTLEIVNLNTEIKKQSIQISATYSSSLLSFFDLSNSNLLISTTDTNNNTNKIVISSSGSGTENTKMIIAKNNSTVSLFGNIEIISTNIALEIIKSTLNLYNLLENDIAVINSKIQIKDGSNCLIKNNTQILSQITISDSSLCDIINYNNDNKLIIGNNEDDNDNIYNDDNNEYGIYLSNKANANIKGNVFINGITSPIYLTNQSSINIINDEKDDDMVIQIGDKNNSNIYGIYFDLSSTAKIEGKININSKEQAIYIKDTVSNIIFTNSHLHLYNNEKEEFEANILFNSTDESENKIFINTKNEGKATCILNQIKLSSQNNLYTTVYDKYCDNLQFSNNTIDGEKDEKLNTLENLEDDNIFLKILTLGNQNDTIKITNIKTEKLKKIYILNSISPNKRIRLYKDTDIVLYYNEYISDLSNIYLINKNDKSDIFIVDKDKITQKDDGSVTIKLTAIDNLNGDYDISTYNINDDIKVLNKKGAYLNFIPFNITYATFNIVKKNGESTKVKYDYYFLSGNLIVPLNGEVTEITLEFNEDNIMIGKFEISNSLNVTYNTTINQENIIINCENSPIKSDIVFTVNYKYLSYDKNILLNIKFFYLKKIEPEIALIQSMYGKIIKLYYNTELTALDQIQLIDYQNKTAKTIDYFYYFIDEDNNYKYDFLIDYVDDLYGNYSIKLLFLPIENSSESIEYYYPDLKFRVDKVLNLKSVAINSKNIYTNYYNNYLELQYLLNKTINNITLIFDGFIVNNRYSIKSNQDNDTEYEVIINNNDNNYQILIQFDESKGYVFNKDNFNFSITDNLKTSENIQFFEIKNLKILSISNNSFSIPKNGNVKLTIIYNMKIDNLYEIHLLNAKSKKVIVKINDFERFISKNNDYCVNITLHEKYQISGKINIKSVFKNVNIDFVEKELTFTVLNKYKKKLSKNAIIGISAAVVIVLFIIVFILVARKFGHRKFTNYNKLAQVSFFPKDEKKLNVPDSDTDNNELDNVLLP